MLGFDKAREKLEDFGLDWKKGQKAKMKSALAKAQQAKSSLRPSRIQRWYHLGFGTELVIDKAFKKNERITLQRIDDYRIVASDESGAFSTSRRGWGKEKWEDEEEHWKRRPFEPYEGSSREAANRERWPAAERG